MRKLLFHSMLSLIAALGNGWAEQGGEISIQSEAGLTAVVVQANPNPNKTYVAKLYTPEGVQVLLDSSPSHVHHHGLMFAFDTPEGDFWLDNVLQGLQQPRGEVVVDNRAVEQTLNWIGVEEARVLTENRQIELVEDRVPQATLLSWVSRIERPSDRPPLKLVTNRAYVGLGVRLPESMDNKASFIFPDGSDRRHIRNTEHVTRDRWCAVIGPVEGEIVTVAMFDHPDNIRHPAAWFTMSDSLSYLSATLGFDLNPLTLESGESLTLKYGIVAWDGARTTEIIEDAYRLWIDSLAETEE